MKKKWEIIHFNWRSIDNDDAKNELIISEEVDKIIQSKYSLEQDINKNINKFQNKLEKKIYKESEIIIYLLSKEENEIFYKKFQYIMKKFSQKLENEIELYLLKQVIYNEENKEDLKLIHITTKKIKKYILTNLWDNSFFWYLLQKIRTDIYVNTNYYIIDWKKHIKTKERKIKEDKIKENIRYLFAKEWKDHSYENLYKILYKLLI